MAVNAEGDLTALQKLARGWHNFWNTKIDITVPRTPIGVIPQTSEDAAPDTHEETIGQATGKAVGAATAPLLLTGAISSLPTTLAGVGAGAVTGAAGQAIGSGVTNWLGGDEYTQEMFGDLGGFAGGMIGGGAGVKGFKLATPNVQKFRLANKLNRSINATKLNPTEIDKAVLSGKVGWAPAQDITWRHGSDNPALREFVPYNRWDVLNRGASPYQYFVTRQGSSTNMMDSRPYQYTGVFHSSKPMVQLNEFNIAGQKNATRNQLLSQARSRGADSYILENIADNKAKNQDVVVRFIDSKGEPIYSQLSEQSSSNSRTLTESKGAVSRMAEPYGGMPAQVIDGEIILPHPFVYKKKYGGKMNYIDFFKNGKKIPKGEVGLRMHSPNIQATVTIPFDRKPSLRFNLSDNINTVNFRNSNKNHDSSFGIGGSYNFDNNSGSLSGSLSYSNNQLPSPISISGFQQFGNPVNIQIPSIDGSINNDRITQLVKFLKSKGKDTNNLSRQDLAVLEKQFQNQSGDDVLRSYDQMSGLFKSGGGIHIKKKNRGKFTEFCGGKVTEECIQKGKHSSNPTTRKRATFAENARHFKHQTGGRVFMQATKVKSDDSTPITRLWDFVSNYSSEEPEKLTITSTVTPKDQDFSGYTLLGTPVSKSAGKMHQDLVDLQNLFTKYNLPITITSGYREGAVTSNGSPSFHASGEAMDIVPTEGHTFQEIADIIRNTPEIANFMKSHKLGVLDETSKEMLARTGGTGAHYHVGRDKNAYKFWQV